MDILREPDPAIRDQILAKLIDFNLTRAPARRMPPLAIVLRDREGTVTGGLWGRLTYDWMFVELLVVPEADRGRGLGRRMMEAAEAVAREENCAGIWLDTYDFQAEGFYARLGYAPFGVIEDHPRGGRRVFLQKRL